MKKNNKLAETVVEIDQYEDDYGFIYRYKKQLLEFIKVKGVYLGGIALIGASSIANFLNFLFNAFLGRVLSFQDFALIGLIGGFLSYASILFGAFTATTNYKSAFLIGKYGENAGYTFWKYIRKKTLIISIFITFIWLLFTPFLTSFFDAKTPLLIIFFGSVLLVGLANGADRGLISARLDFGGLALVNLLDPVIKLITAVVLVFIGLKFWTFSGVPLAVLGTFVLGWLIVVYRKDRKEIIEHEKEIKSFPFKFFLASLLTGFSSIVFFSSDILFANHYLSSVEAGKYTLISLVGKMIYYLGGLVTPFIIPIISRIEGARKDSQKTMYIMLFSTLTLAFVGFLSFGVMGFLSIPFLYGKKALQIVQYLSFFTFGMMCYATSKVLVNYYLVKKIYTFTVATSLLFVLQFGLLVAFHNNAGTIAIVMTSIWIIHLLLTLSLHSVVDRVKETERNFSLFLRGFSQNHSL